MLDGDTLVFTEVRYRKNSLHGSGADSVTRAKQQRLIRAARLYLQRYAPNTPPACRFDVVSIGAENGRTVINWIQNAFEAG